MDYEYLVKIINEKFNGDLELENIPDEYYFNNRAYFVVNFRVHNVSDCRNMVFVGFGTRIEDHAYFNDENEASKYFRNCVKIINK